MTATYKPPRSESVQIRLAGADFPKEWGMRRQTVVHTVKAVVDGEVLYYCAPEGRMLATWVPWERATKFTRKTDAERTRRRYTGAWIETARIGAHN